MPDAIDENGKAVHESTGAAMYLKSKGIPANAIFREWASYDTIGKIMRSYRFKAESKAMLSLHEPPSPIFEDGDI